MQVTQFYLNHFSQPDSIIPDPGNPQSWDRYAYALNNPIKYNDPSGHWEVETNQPDKEQRRNAYIHAAQRIKKNDSLSAHLKEYYWYAAATYNAMAYEEPQEVIDLGLSYMEGRANNVRINGWNSETDSWSAAADASGYEALGIASGIVTVGAGAFVPNPGGINGNPDHEAGVYYATSVANEQYLKEQGYEYEYNVSIASQNGGIDRRPDLTVWKDGKLVHVYEVARTYSNGCMVTREQLKMVEYWENGIPYTFYTIK